MSRANPGRVAAVRVLVGVEGGAHAEDLLAELAPPPPDRALAWNLALGVLRRRGTLDALLAPLVRGGLDRLQPPVRAALRVGAYELKFARTRDHAAVDQAVEVTRATGAGRAAGLVNAVLRKAARGRVSDDPWLDLPPWLRRRWRGWDAWVARLAEPPALCGSWRDAPVEGLATAPAEAGGEAVPGCFRLVDPGGPVPELPGFAEGRWWVMDPAAARVADLARGERVLDACAAPGGKSFRLAAAGAAVTAVDADDERLARVGEGAARLDLPVALHRHDWLDGPAPDLPRDFDAVLVDAPCTALGTVRRHPEIRWRRRPGDPAAMAPRQLAILRAAAEHVADGGRLVYAVCSPEPEEGEGVVSRLAGWRVVDAWASAPPAGDEDAFQAFVLERAGG